MTRARNRVAAAGIGLLLLLIGTTVGIHLLKSHRQRTIVPEAILLPSTAPTYAGPPITGCAVTPDGKPVAAAAVYVTAPDVSLTVYAGPPLSLDAESAVLHMSPSGELEFLHYSSSAKVERVPAVAATTDGDGRFTLQPTCPPAGIVVISSTGLGLAPAASVAAGRKITVKPWSRIEGTVLAGTQPQADVSIWWMNVDDPELVNQTNVELRGGANGDKSGHFIVERAYPGAAHIGTWFNSDPRRKVVIDRDGRIATADYYFHPGFWLERRINVPATQPLTVQLGGTGRPMIGHLSQPVVDYAVRCAWLSGDPPFDTWNRYGVAINPDGTFGMQDLPAGKYHLHADFGQFGGDMHPIPYKYVSYFASADKDFVIPPMPGGRSDEVLDIGGLPLRPNARLEVGATVPEMAFKPPDGPPKRLSDFRGKLVLLQLWSGKREYLKREEDHAKGLLDRFGDDPRFALLGINIAPAEPLKSAAAENVRWPQYVPTGTVPEEFLSSGSSFFLIDPQGKLLARDMGAFAMYDVIDRALGRSKPGAAMIQVDHVPRGEVDASTPYSVVPVPTLDNAARRGSITVVDGIRSQRSGPPGRLLDGRMADKEDSPTQALKFEEATLEGRFKIDLGKVISIAQINTYSWHKDTRAPQVYKVYGSDGTAANSTAAPRIGVDPRTCGWTKIAAVDSRPESGPPGGRYAVGISDPSGSLGSYRYLLFCVFPTETADDWGFTFYDEVTVMEQK